MSRFFVVLFIFLNGCYANVVMAEGLERVNTVMEKVQGALNGVSYVAVVIAILWAGYKILYGGQTFREASPILIGGIVIGAASQIASLLIN